MSCSSRTRKSAGDSGIYLKSILRFRSGTTGREALSGQDQRLGRIVEQQPQALRAKPPVRSPDRPFGEWNEFKIQQIALAPVSG